MKAAKEVGCRRQPIRWRRRVGRQRAVAGEGNARRDSGGGAEARAPYRRRRAHSHQPGLCSDKWGASCPDGGAVAGGPRPPSEGWRSWSYEAGPAADTASAWSVLPYMRPPAATPQPSPTRPSRQRPREGGNPPGGAASLPPQSRRAATPSTADEERRPPCPQVDADPALLEVMQRAPTGSNPPPRLSAEDTPWANRPSKGPRPKSIKGGSSNSLGKSALARKQLLFYPPASFKRRQKNTKQSYTGGLIIRHVCSPRRPNPPMKCPAAEQGEHRSRRDRRSSTAPAVVFSPPSGGGYRRGRCEGYRSS